MSSNYSRPASNALPSLSESDVQAFADGALAPDHEDSVRQYLTAHPGEAHRVAFYTRLNHEMRSLFEQPATHFAPQPMPRRGRALTAALTIITSIFILMALFAVDVSDTQFNRAAMHAMELIGPAVPPPVQGTVN